MELLNRPNRPKARASLVLGLRYARESVSDGLAAVGSSEEGDMVDISRELAVIRVVSGDSDTCTSRLVFSCALGPRVGPSLAVLALVKWFGSRGCCCVCSPAFWQIDSILERCCPAYMRSLQERYIVEQKSCRRAQTPCTWNLWSSGVQTTRSNSARQSRGLSTSDEMLSSVYTETAYVAVDAGLRTRKRNPKYCVQT